jgi:hypothetical protein
MMSTTGFGMTILQREKTRGEKVVALVTRWRALRDPVARFIKRARGAPFQARIDNKSKRERKFFSRES